MKKVWIWLLVAFVAVALLATSIVFIIFATKNSNEEASSDIEETISKAPDNSQINTTIGIDLNGTYDQNDLLIEILTKDFNGSEISLPQISGLKDEAVQEKINKDIVLSLETAMKDLSQIDYSYAHTSANFANVISISYNYSDGDNYDNLYLNYNLIDGSRLYLEDLFIEGTDILDIVRSGFYKSMAVYGEYDRETYVVSPDEMMVYRAVRDYMALDEKEFAFSPSEIFLYNSDNMATIQMLDIAEKVDIYTKYLTEEDIFTGEYPGYEDIFTCANCEQYSIFENINYGIGADNLWYDITTGLGYMADEENVSSEKKSAFEDFKASVYAEYYKEIEKQIAIAEKNPEKFYILFIKPYISMYSDSKYINGKWNYISSNGASVSCTIQLFEMPLELYETTYKQKLVDTYRYPYFAMRGGAYLDRENLEGATLTETDENKLFNFVTGEEYAQLEDLFHEGVDYMSTINQKVIQRLSDRDYSSAEISQLMETMNIQVGGSSIIVTFPSIEDWSVWISYSEFDISTMRIFD